MKYNLFLDDYRLPRDAARYIVPVELRPMYIKEEWVLVKDYNQFVKYITKNGMPDKISFDHDLSDEHYGLLDTSNHVSLEEYYLLQDREFTGYDCCLWLTEYADKNNLELPETFYHSMNQVGCANMKSLIDNFKKSKLNEKLI